MLTGGDARSLRGLSGLPPRRTSPAGRRQSDAVQESRNLFREWVNILLLPEAQVPRSMRLKEPMKIFRLPGREETMKALCEFEQMQMKEARVRVMVPQEVYGSIDTARVKY